MICPICKYSNEERNFNLEAAQIKRRMPKHMRDRIGNLIKEISSITSYGTSHIMVSYEDIYKLIYAIRHFGYLSAERAIDNYIYYGYHRQGKGLNYLIGIIRRTSEGIEAQTGHENTLQAIPPEVKDQ